jgi:hypothetical protein
MALVTARQCAPFALSLSKRCNPFALSLSKRCNPFALSLSKRCNPFALSLSKRLWCGTRASTSSARTDEGDTQTHSAQRMEKTRKPTAFERVVAGANRLRSR